MFSSLFRQLTNSIGVVLRTFRAFFLRQIMAVWARVKSVTSLTQQASKLAPKMLKTATDAGKKPTKREDYVETERLLIAKSFFVILISAIVVAVLLIHFLIWPWMVSTFFTAHLWVEDSRTADYSGKVALYYDESKHDLMFRGRLSDGVMTGDGLYYDENGLLVYDGTYVDGLYDGDGSLYSAGVLVYKGSFAAGQYEGTGTLYAENGDLLYEGEFSAGVYSGEGKAYEDGTLVYEGTFADGVYSGAGKGYENGTLLYDGEFKDGLYEGEGQLFDETGALVYKGSFAEGEYSGDGLEYAGGALSYKGAFSEGLRSGDGVEYFENGQVKYKGTFLDGQYSDSGTLYNEDGSTLYTGGFAEGEYSGDGTLYLGQGQRVSAEFENGEPDGSIELYQNGVLVYDGESDGLTPNGAGVVYAADGGTLFTGSMAQGTVDGAQLLGLGVNDLRTALGDAALTQTLGSDSFTIASATLGLTAVCSYQTSDADAAVNDLFVCTAGQPESTADLLVCKDADSFDDWISKVADGTPERSAGYGRTSFPSTVAVPEKASSAGWYTVSYSMDGYTCRLWLDGENGKAFAMEWRADQTSSASAAQTDSDTDPNTEADDSAKRLDSLLSKLESTHVGGSTETTESAYFGGKSAEDLLSLAGTADSGETLSAAETAAAKQTARDAAYDALDTALDYFECAESLTADESKSKLYQELLNDEQALALTGTGSEDIIKQYKSKISDLDLEITKYKAQLAKNSMTLKNAVGDEPKNYELEELLLLFDPSEVDTSALLSAIVEHATELAETQAQIQAEKDAKEAAAQAETEKAARAAIKAAESAEPLPKTSAEQETAITQTVTNAAEGASSAPAQIDADSLKLEMNMSLIELEVAWQELEKARTASEDAETALAAARSAYKTGSVTKADVYDAIASQNDCESSLYAAMTGFTETAAELDQLSGGWLAKQYGWLTDVFAS